MLLEKTVGLWVQGQENVNYHVSGVRWQHCIDLDLCQTERELEGERVYVLFSENDK